METSLVLFVLDLRRELKSEKGLEKLRMAVVRRQEAQKVVEIAMSRVEERMKSLRRTEVLCR